MDEKVVFLLYANDGSQIADVVKKSLEKVQLDISVNMANIMDVHNPPAAFTALLFLTPNMLSVLKSSCLPDLTWLSQRSKMSALFFHKTINFTAEDVQEALLQTLPSYREWRVYPLAKKVPNLIAQILQLIETDDEEADPELSLVSDCTFHPKHEWMENQTVFIYFDTERREEDRVTVEVDKRLTEATRVNPFTFCFTCKEFGDCGHQNVKVFVNEDVTLSTQVFIKNRDHILHDEISKMDSPLHYLQSILKKIKYNEGALALPAIDAKILEGTKKLLKRLNKIPDDEISIVQHIAIQEEEERHIVNKEDESDAVRRRPNSQAVRSRRTMRGLSGKDSGISSGYTEMPAVAMGGDETKMEEQKWGGFSFFKKQISLLKKHQSKRISRALQNLDSEDIPTITVNPQLKKSLQEDFFDSLDFNKIT